MRAVLLKQQAAEQRPSRSVGVAERLAALAGKQRLLTIAKQDQWLVAVLGGAWPEIAAMRGD